MASTHRRSGTNTIKVYKSYNFIDKDPVIDTVRTLVQDSGESYEKVHDLSGVAAHTLSAWFNGKTRRPQFATVAAVVYALGGSMQIVDQQGHAIVAAPPKARRRHHNKAAATRVRNGRVDVGAVLRAYS